VPSSAVLFGLCYNYHRGQQKSRHQTKTEILEICMKNFTKTAILSTALLISGAAFADRDDVRLLSETKINLTEAIAIAEKHQNGRAYEAELDSHRFAPVYEVKVVTSDNRVYEVNIDGVTGEVRNVKEDLDD
jgi:uncharacterized membrane protein YkoI